ncbi:MAG: hypothetical protein ACRDJ4_01485 [Actinomycetota bacterium]
MPVRDIRTALAAAEELFAGLAKNQQGIDDFVSVLAGTKPVEEFFHPANLAAYVSTSR